MTTSIDKPRRLLIARRSFGENREAEEFQFLDRTIELNARAVFDHVTVAALDELARPTPVALDVDAVLVLGPEPVYLGATSLALMDRELAAGASEVRPYRLADSELPKRSPVRTLSDYERLEEAFTREAPAATVSRPRSLRPVALTTPARLDAIVRGGALDDDTAEGDDALAACGLCYVFIDYFGETREDIAPLLPDRFRSVLEIGCGRGATGRYLKERFGCSVTGVELNPLVAARAAEQLDRVVVQDAEAVTFDETFEVILALDVVEHLARPEALLSRLPRWLRPGGRAILSIPNVGHHAIVRDLLAGRWDYVPIGLLCYTHLRFYTRSSLEALCQRSGIERFEILLRKTEPPEWLVALPETLPVDRESLETEGFYVIIHG